MKLSIASDLHLEFGGNVVLENIDNTDVLILAGDIVTAYDIAMAYDLDMSLSEFLKSSAGKYHTFMDDVSSKWKHVIVVAGNHEFYEYKWLKTLDILRSFYAQWDNVIFLEDNVVTIEGIKFGGSTLWTDFNRFDARAMSAASFGMNDFRCIQHEWLGGVAVRPAMAYERHKRSLGYIECVKPDVVISHHLPHYGSIHPMYRNGNDLNYSFFSDLTDTIEKVKPKLWVHGHTHMPCDYVVDATRVLCHPKGYPNEHRMPYQPKTVEL